MWGLDKVSPKTEVWGSTDSSRSMGLCEVDFCAPNPRCRKAATIVLDRLAFGEEYIQVLDTTLSSTVQVWGTGLRLRTFPDYCNPALSLTLTSSLWTWQMPLRPPAHPFKRLFHRSFAKMSSFPFLFSLSLAPHSAASSTPFPSCLMSLIPQSVSRC